ncbi:hypothetical protein B296_00043146, partial [Ensete ventricosum]
MDMLRQLLSGEDIQADFTSWSTCIILPFRSKLVQGTTMSSIISMFSDLHPSLLLFLHRLRCIRFKNMLNNTSIVLRRETMDDGIVKVSHGNERMSWLVVSKKLQASVIRQGAQTTEIAMAFTLQESERGEYRPLLSQQPAFAFLPLRNYGLKFILQGDFILPSSREEVDGDSAWNQWLLSEFPALFVSAEQSFCSLPCYKENPGKAVTAFMNFVPLAGEVHGFFSHLPHMIISKLRMSNCLLLDGPTLVWVLPCRTLRGWDEQFRLLVSDRSLQKHLGLGYLNKDVILSDTLAKALGVQNYGPKVLIDLISSLSHCRDGIKSLGLNWLSSWFIILYSALSSQASVQFSANLRMESDLVKILGKIPLIPLSDGSYASMSDGPIWLPCDICSAGPEGKQYQNDFPRLYDKLRIVNPLLFSAPDITTNYMEEKKVDNLIQMLYKIGVQQLSAHQVIKSHILSAFDKETKQDEDNSWKIEYLAFIMVHLQLPCASCDSEKEDIISELRKRSIVLTNAGYRCPDNEPVHFSKEYGNPVDISKLSTLDFQWLEVDLAYLKHPSTRSLASITSKLLLKEIGFKTQLSHDDALTMLNYWRASKAPPFLASLAVYNVLFVDIVSMNQMSKFYTFIWDGVATSGVNITKEFISSCFIFVPFLNTSASKKATYGTFLSPKDVFWHDPTGCVDKVKEVLQCIQKKNSDFLPCEMLSSVYPGLHEFFVHVFRVFLRWSDDVKSGLVKSEDILDLRNDLHKLESRVLPTMQDKWVSLHSSFGLVCWVDDEDLKLQFKHSNGIDFLQFGELNNEEKEMLSGKIAKLFKKLGLPALSELSRFFFDGSAELHFANFLHMVTAMAESGSSIDQTEFFIVNSQKVPRLPDEEPVWSLSSAVEELDSEITQPTLAPCSNAEQNASMPQRKPGICPSWPPTDWKTAPDFSHARRYGLRSRPGMESYGGSEAQLRNLSGATTQTEVLPDPIEMDEDWVVEEGLAPKSSSVLQDDSGILKEETQLADSFDALDDQVNGVVDSGCKTSRSLLILHNWATKSAAAAIEKRTGRREVAGSLAMDLPVPLLLLLLLLCLRLQPSSSSSSLDPSVLEANAIDCTNVPYPFGVRNQSLFLPGFEVECDPAGGVPTLSIGTKNVQLLNISVQEGYVRALLSPFAYGYCHRGLAAATTGISLEGTPYTFSDTRNRYTVIGCDAMVVFQDRGGSRADNYTRGCVAFCPTKFVQQSIVNGYCSGIGCCQVAVPPGLKSFNVSLSSIRNLTHFLIDNGTCSEVFLVDHDVFSFSATDVMTITGITTRPVVLDWAIGNETCEEVQRRKPPDYACVDGHSRCYNS